VLLNEAVHDFDHWLEKMTPRMKHGALRRLYSPQSGRRIDQLSELSDGNSYVVARQERFKRVPYLNIENLRTRELKYKLDKVARLTKRSALTS
jgi:hypothetical protein